MDLYLIGRIFRSFDKKSYKSTNIIIYTGSYHTDKYIEMLEEFNFKKIYTFNSIDDLEKYACLKVDNFNMEYF